MPDERLRYDIEAVDKGASEVLRRISKAADDTSKAHDKAAKAAESGAARGAKAARLLGNAFAASSAGALGPLQEVIGKLQAVGDAAEATSSRTSKVLIGGGAALLGVSALLQSIASKDQEAQQQLQASIAATGKSYSDYSEEIEKTVTRGEHFGKSANQTLDALNRLTLKTHDPKEALEAYQTALDIAAAKHIDLSKAADIAGAAFNGESKAGRQFGLQLTQVTILQRQLTAARTTATQATDAARKAQDDYTQMLDLYNLSSKHTLSQQVSLYNSHKHLVEAQEASRVAQERLKAAQDKVNDSAKTQENNLHRVAEVVKGQAAAQADSFSGKLRALGAHIDDTAAKLGHEYGGALQTTSLLMIAAGSVAELKLGSKIASLGGIFSRSAKAAEGAAAVTNAAVGGEATAAEIAAGKVAASEAEIASAAAASATSVEGSAAAASAAMEAEAATAVSVAGRIRAALAGIGIAGAAGGVGSLLLAGGDSRQLPQSDLRKSLLDITNKLDPAKVTGDKQAAADLYAKVFGLKPGQTAIGTSGLNKAAAIQYLVDYADLSDPKVASVLTALGYSPHKRGSDVNSDNPNVATRAQNAAAAAAAAHGGKGGPAGGGFDLQGFLNSIGGGPVATGGGSGGGGSKGAGAAQAAAKRAIEALYKTQIDGAKAALASENKLIDATRGRISAIKSLQQSYAQYGQQITDSYKQANSIFNVFGNASSNGVQAGAVDLIYGLQGKATQESNLLGELQNLEHRGLNKGLLQQLYEAGPDQAGLIGALFHSSDAQLQQINAAQGSVDSVAAQLGRAGIANKFGQDAQTRAANELAGQTKLLQQEIVEQKKGNALIASLAKELAAALNGTVSTATRQGGARVAR